MENMNYNQNYNQNDMNGQQPSYPPKSYLVESILVTIFCCLPFGIVGIINASKVENRFYRGDYFGAERASQEAKKYTIIAFVVGIITFGIYSIISLFN